MTPPIDPQDEFLIRDVLGDSGADELETVEMPAARAYKISPRRRYERITQKQQLLQVIPKPPAPGESIHVIGTGRYDFWTFVPQMIDWLGRADELYCSTWTLSRPNAAELFEVWDAARIAAVTFLTGLYFKRRETAIYTFLLNGIRARGGRYRAFPNHAKVLLLANAHTGDSLTVEGSANLTGNPRLEQYIITNDAGLYAFHRAWMEEALAAPATPPDARKREPRL